MEMAIIMARVWIISFSLFFNIYSHRNLAFCGELMQMLPPFLLSQDAGMDWIIHLDTDELIHPAGAREYSLRRLLLDVPDNVDMVIFPNYVSHRSNIIFVVVECSNMLHISLLYIFVQESSIERDDIKDPFTEVCVSY